MHRKVLSRAFLSLAIAGLVALPAIPAAAQVGASSGSASATYDPERVVTTVVQQDLVALVQQRGDSVVSEGELGDYSVLAQSMDGLYYVLIGTACDLPDYGEGCLGIDFQVRYDADSAATYEKINEINLTFSAAKTSRGYNEAGGDTLFVTHYTMLDGGQKMGNLEIIILNLLDIAPQVQATIWP